MDNFWNGISGLIEDYLITAPGIIILGGLVIGGTLLMITGKKGVEFVKEHAVWFALGAAILLGASTVTEYVISKFTF